MSFFHLAMLWGGLFFSNTSWLKHSLRCSGATGGNKFTLIEVILCKQLITTGLVFPLLGFRSQLMSVHQHRQKLPDTRADWSHRVACESCTRLRRLPGVRHELNPTWLPHFLPTTSFLLLNFNFCFSNPALIS